MGIALHRNGELLIHSNEWLWYKENKSVFQNTKHLFLNDIFQPVSLKWQMDEEDNTKKRNQQACKKRIKENVPSYFFSGIFDIFYFKNINIVPSPTEYKSRKILEIKSKGFGGTGAKHVRNKVEGKNISWQKWLYLDKVTFFLAKDVSFSFQCHDLIPETLQTPASVPTAGSYVTDEAAGVELYKENACFSTQRSAHSTASWRWKDYIKITKSLLWSIIK